MNLMQSILLLSLGGSLLALLFLALRPLLHRRLRKTAVYYLWLLVLLRFALPLPSPLQMPEFPATPEQNTLGLQQMNANPQAPTPMETAPVVTTPLAVNQPEGTPNSAPIAPETEGTPDAAPSLTRQSLPTLSLWQGLTILWAVGALGCLGWQLWRYHRFARTLRQHLYPATEAQHAELASLTTDGKVPALALCPLVESPMLLGLRKPTILLPGASYSPERLRHILAHELCHYRRGDLYYKWFAMLLACVHWFNPLVYVMLHLLDQDCELACDEAVIAAMDTEERRHYGETLLQLACGPRPVLATSMGQAKTQMKKRVINIMSLKKRTKRTVALGLAIALLLSGCGTLLGAPRMHEEEITPDMLPLPNLPSTIYYFDENGVAQELLQVGGENEDITTAQYSWYVDTVIEQVIADLTVVRGYSEEAATMLVNSGGLQIYSCLNPAVQEAVDAVYLDQSSLPYVAENGEPLQSAITVIDNETGQIVALAGGVGEKTGNSVFAGWSEWYLSPERGMGESPGEGKQLNLATRVKRQPGSALTPLSVYAPALDMGLITPDSIEVDRPNENGWPANTYGSYRGEMSIREALRISSNAVAVRVLEKITPEKSFYYVSDSFRIPLIESMVNPENDAEYTDIAPAPLALGGLTYGVTNLEMATAYSSFARDGVYDTPRAYTKVTDRDGVSILENHLVPMVGAKEKTAHDMTDMLQTVVENGTGKNANFEGQAIAGKTGVTDSQKDLWFVGYTPYYTAAVWTGYETHERIAGGGNPSVNLWKQVMEAAHAGLPNKDFSAPNTDEMVIMSVCSQSGLVPREQCGENVITGSFFKADAPTSFCTVTH